MSEIIQDIEKSEKEKAKQKPETDKIEIEFEEEKEKLEESKEQQKLLEKQRKQDILMRNHALLFVAVNALLYIINYSVNFSYQWYLWSLSTWGVGLLLHTFAYLLSAEKIATDKKLLYYHTYIFLITSGYLIFVNFFTSTEVLWSFYTVAAWFVVLFAHFYVLWNKYKQ